MRPGLSEVRTTPHCLVRALSNDDLPTFDLPKGGRECKKNYLMSEGQIWIMEEKNRPSET